MRYTVRKSVIHVVGKIWMPADTVATTLTLSDYDVGNIETPVTRETIQDWLDKNAVDFQAVTDFDASLEVGTETVEIPWQSEDSALVWSEED
jgi:hypothetical protein